LPFCNNRPARTRFFVASSIAFLAMPHISIQLVVDITHEATIGCHDL
jgi:hypothetical protein